MVYQPAIIETFAERLYAQANRIIALASLLGILAGGAAGAVFNVVTNLNALEITALVGIVLGGLFGFLIGSERAFALKLQAQQAMCQLQIELNTRGIAGMAPHVGGALQAASGR